ncbi:hypothetical protein BD779DRAFT_1508982 [Infundibulicybe gibba]|nr:hypothetical protein BD779DRAFT_1508982 [Infundibulicybe gibba]
MSDIPTGISRIPPEILGEIFIHSLAVDFPSQSAQFLSSVCKLWRALVLAAPALWASLDIICNMDVLYPPLPVIHSHLERSGAHPLSFTLRSKDFHNINTNLFAALKTLTAARQRWCNVHIELARITKDTLGFITLGDAPLLQSIRCHVLQSSMQRLPIPLHMVHYHPRLESFQWDSLGSPLRLPLGNTQLTSLSLRTNLSVPECVTLLRLSPRLSSAKFNSFRPASAPPSIPHLTHPALCTLSIVGEYSDMFLSALTLPALLDLDLVSGGTMELPTKWEVVLPPFLARSNPTLRRLSLSMTRLQSLDPALLRILALTPHLRTLRLSNCLLDPAPLTAALIHVLHPTPSPGVPLCPHIRRLQLSRISDCPDGLCGAMLRARWGTRAQANGVACLEWAHIELEGGVHDCDKADMEELCAEGMRGILRLRD